MTRIEHDKPPLMSTNAPPWVYFVGVLLAGVSLTLAVRWFPGMLGWGIGLLVCLAIGYLMPYAIRATSRRRGSSEDLED